MALWKSGLLPEWCECVRRALFRWSPQVARTLQVAVQRELAHLQEPTSAGEHVKRKRVRTEVPRRIWKPIWVTLMLHAFPASSGHKRAPKISSMSRRKLKWSGNTRARKRGALHPLGVLACVIIRNPHKHYESSFDGAYRLPIHTHAAPQHSLNDGSHLGRFRV